MRCKSVLFLCTIIFLSLLLNSCNQDNKNSKILFKRIPSSHSKINFSNRLTEDDDFNIIQYLYFYNGGGVALGDINNDGLVDIYFSSNQNSNRLYLNLGDFKFKDITESSGVEGLGNWKTGVTMVDVNGDGFLDIFSCGVGGYKNFNGRNQLLLNNGDLTFTDKTEVAGLEFQGFSTQSVFFDYDNDGDLDMYLVNHSVHSVRSYGDVQLRYQSDAKAGDKMYRNDLVPTGTLHFTDVTSTAGIFNSQIGYGLGAGVSDLNNDGFMDIYVSNDFHENDYLYINQKDGTFKQVLEESIPHSSRFSMGNDIGDINNDGWQDIISLDMLPKDESIIKASAGEDPPDIFQFKLRFGYHYQVARNVMQLNRGIYNNKLFFSDIAPLAGVEATDWSWSPLLADFDNDGLKDLFIANGIMRRPNDLDYINYISTDSAQRFLTDKQMIDKMPEGMIPNYFYKNNGNLTFTDVSASWIGTSPTLSNGAAYTDLDNDGDLDLVINNVNEEASLYRNETKSNFIRVELKGTSPNTQGIGTKLILYSPSGLIKQEVVATRGWESSVSGNVLFGLANHAKADSLLVIWPNGKFQKLENISANQLIVINQSDNDSEWNYNSHQPNVNPLLTLSDSLSYRYIENNFNAFEAERLIPHALTSQGPKISVSDVNSDRLDDVFIGGGKDQTGKIFIQNKNGTFKPEGLELISDNVKQNISSCFFDANNDGSPDLMVASSVGNDYGHSASTQVILYLNNGKGNFKITSEALPVIKTNASCILPFDYDKDGDMDVFIGGRFVTGSYGLTPESYLLKNDGKGNFTDVTIDHFSKSDLGMITDGIWHDVDGDKLTDLVVVGEWMPVTILIQNKSGKFINKTGEYGLDRTHGWWNCITKSDIDMDGDDDFILGNIGLNSRLRASAEEPIELFVTDIDGNGSFDPLLTYYNNHHRYPFISKDQLIKQVPPLKKKFLKYNDFRDAHIEDILNTSSNSQSFQLKAEEFASVWLENLGSGKYQINSLPIEAQVFPVFSILAEDVNNDSVIDLILAGNWKDIQPDVGRYDSGYGLVLLGDGKGNFKPLTIQESGFFVRGEVRDIKSVDTKEGKKIFVTRNNDSVLIFKQP